MAMLFEAGEIEPVSSRWLVHNASMYAELLF